MQQQLPGLGLIVPKSDLNMHTANSNVTNSEPGIDLRSLFANGLGFEGVEDYVPETNLSLESDMANVSIETNEAKNTGKKNKNKKKKKGKKKKVRNMLLKHYFFMPFALLTYITLNVWFMSSSRGNIMRKNSEK